MGQTRSNVLCVGLVLVGSAGGALAGSFVYRADRGGNTNAGPAGFDANATWGNYFHAEPGFETITALRFSFGTDFADAGRSLELLVYEDPDDDGDPTNAVLVSQTNSAAVLTPNDEVIEYAIDPVSISGGFFVAVNMDAFDRELIFRSDTSIIDPLPSTTSWFFYNPFGTPQLDLGASLFVGFPGDVGLGTWVVRAVGVPGPGAAAVFGVAGAFASRRRR